MLTLATGCASITTDVDSASSSALNETPITDGAYDGSYATEISLRVSRIGAEPTGQLVGEVVGELSDGPISCKGPIVEATLTDARSRCEIRLESIDDGVRLWGKQGECIFVQDLHRRQPGALVGTYAYRPTILESAIGHEQSLEMEVKDSTGQDLSVMISVDNLPMEGTLHQNAMNDFVGVLPYRGGTCEVNAKLSVARPLGYRFTLFGVDCIRGNVLHRTR